VDDAASMRPYWHNVKSVLRVLAYMLKSCDDNGMDLYFTIATTRCNSKTSTGLVQHLSGKALKGTSDIGSRLSTILHEYQTSLRQPISPRWFGFVQAKQGTVKPLNVYILTDAIWQPQSDAVEPITALIKTLQELNYPRKQVGIQFIRFGNDPEGIKKLEHLDSGLGLSMYVNDN
jgi:hypothetical protein